PARAGTKPGAWLTFQPSGLDDDVAFGQALQEIAHAVGETMEVDSVCAAAVLAMVRCAQVSRAEVYLTEEGRGLHRVAVSDAAAGPDAPAPLPPAVECFERALATRQPQIGVHRANGDPLGSIYAAVPLLSQRRTVGL